MALVLMKPELDQWNPGEHNGTFRGNNLAFVSATEAIKKYWVNNDFSEEIQAKSEIIRDRLEVIASNYPELELNYKGRGMICGLESENPKIPNMIKELCFEKGLIIETSGSDDQVLKLLPALTIPEDVLFKGLNIIKEATKEVAEEFRKENN